MENINRQKNRDYQCNSLGGDIRGAINDYTGRDKLYDLIKDAHGKNGDFTSRTNVEMNIYYDGQYEVEGGLKDEVEVEPWNQYNGN